MFKTEVVIINDRTAQFSQVVDEAIKTAITKACFDTEAEAKVLVPKKTTTLEQSIMPDLSKIDSLTGEVYSSVEYSLYVELGTVKMGARPYLLPAAESAGDELDKVIVAIIDQEFK